MTKRARDTRGENFGLTSPWWFVTIVCAFALYGHLSTPEGSPPIRDAEWTIYHGLIGIGVALNLATSGLFSSNGIRQKMNMPLRFVCLVLALAFTTATIPTLILGLNSIELGENHGSLFSGDSGFAIFVVAFYCAMWSLATLVCFTLYEFARKQADKN